MNIQIELDYPSFDRAVLEATQKAKEKYPDEYRLYGKLKLDNVELCLSDFKDAIYAYNFTFEKE